MQNTSRTRTDRRSLASLLIGIIAALGGLWAATFVRSDRCLDAGGRWTPGAHVCELPAGVTPPAGLGVLTPYLLGVLVAVGIAFVLWRVYLVASGARPVRPAR